MTLSNDKKSKKSEYICKFNELEPAPGCRRAACLGGHRPPHYTPVKSFKYIIKMLILNGQRLEREGHLKLY